MFGAKCLNQPAFPVRGCPRVNKVECKAMTRFDLMICAGTSSNLTGGGLRSPLDGFWGLAVRGVRVWSLWSPCSRIWRRWHLHFSLAFYRLYRKQENCDSGETCAVPSVRRRQRLIFWVVALVAGALMAFPLYAPLAKVDFKLKRAVVAFDPARAKPEALMKATADAGLPSSVKQLQ